MAMELYKQGCMLIARQQCVIPKAKRSSQLQGAGCVTLHRTERAGPLALPSAAVENTSGAGTATGAVPGTGAVSASLLNTGAALAGGGTASLGAASGSMTTLGRTDGAVIAFLGSTAATGWGEAVGFGRAKVNAGGDGGDAAGGRTASIDSGGDAGVLWLGSTEASGARAEGAAAASVCSLIGFAAVGVSAGGAVLAV